ncbi:MAG: PAS domain S-box protein [Myxococcales bacterium]|nr:PAS domain S-box protein [Myxococcales bacterium]
MATVSERVVRRASQVEIAGLDASTLEALRHTLSMLHDSPVGLACCGLDAVIVAANPAFEAMLGYEPGGLQGRAISSFSHPHDLSREALALGPIFAHQSDEATLEKRYLHADGSTVWCRVYLRALRNADGALKGFISTVESRLPTMLDPRTESEALFAEVFDLAPTGLLLLTPDGMVARTNRRFAELLGYESQALTTRSIFDFMAPDDRAASRAEMAQARAGRHSGFECARHFLHREGHAIETRSAVTVMRDAEGRAAALLERVEDVSLRRAQEARERAQEARAQHAQRVESLGLLAGAVAHDFNNLLTIIAANLELMQGELPARSGLEESHAQALEATARAAELAAQMLAYSGRSVSTPRRVDLAGLTAQNVRLLRAAVPPSCELVMQHEAGCPPCLVDPTQFQQVVMNLCLNAADALAGRPGRVVVSTGHRFVDRQALARCVYDDGLPEGAYGYVTVSDDGPGIAEALLPRVFEPYVSTRGTGRGLGLSTVLGIARSHRGAVQVETEAGQGTRMTVLFPLAEAPETARGRGGRGTVLVVDDEPAVARVLQRMLERESFATRVAHDGLEALDYLQQGLRPVAVITDIAMPRMDGVALARALRTRGLTAPIVLVSGYADLDLSGVLTSVEPALFLSKPVTLKALSEALEAAQVTA